MRRFVSWQNIERFRRLLDNKPDEARRKTLEKLLAEERAIWAELLDQEEPEALTRKSA